MTSFSKSPRLLYLWFLTRSCEHRNKKNWTKENCPVHIHRWGRKVFVTKCILWLIKSPVFNLHALEIFVVAVQAPSWKNTLKSLARPHSSSFCASLSIWSSKLTYVCIHTHLLHPWFGGSTAVILYDTHDRFEYDKNKEEAIKALRAWSTIDTSSWMYASTSGLFIFTIIRRKFESVMLIMWLTFTIMVSNNTRELCNYSN